ncbi:MAG: DMT family transporter [Parachlamydiaceae bacterium]
MNKSTSSQNILKGSLLALNAFFLMAVFGILTKFSLQTSSFLWTSFIAYFTGSSVLTPYILRKGPSYLKSAHYGKLIGRAVFGTMASFLYTVSLQFIPIVNGTLLFNTAPIFIPLLSLIFLRTNISRSIWIAVAIGFFGIILIIHPTAEIFTQTGNIVGLLSGIFLAIAYLLMKLLTGTDPGIRIIFYYLGIGACMQAPMLPFYTMPDPLGALYAALSGLMLLLAQVMLVTAYRFAQASEVGVYQYASVVFVGLFQWIFWNQTPTPSEILGALFVIAAGIIIIRSNDKTIQETV